MFECRYLSGYIVKCMTFDPYLTLRNFARLHTFIHEPISKSAFVRKEAKTLILHIPKIVFCIIEGLSIPLDSLAYRRISQIYYH